MDLKLLSQILSISSCSGYEQDMLNFISNYASNINEEFSIESDSRWLEIRKDNNKKENITIIFHADEVGFILTKQTGGKFSLKKKGGLIKSSFIGVTASVDDYIGVIVPENENDLYIEKIGDIDLSIDFLKKTTHLKHLERKQVEFNTHFKTLDSSVVGKGLDNKIGIYLACRILPILKCCKYNVSLFFSTEEEINNCVYPDHLFNSDLIICVDAFSTLEDDCNRGKGVVVSLPPNSNSTDYLKITNKLKNNNILFQLSYVENNTGTELDLITQDNRNNKLKYLILSYPTSYMHSINEVVMYSDIISTEKAINLYISNEKQITSYS